MELEEGIPRIWQNKPWDLHVLSTLEAAVTPAQQLGWHKGAGGLGQAASQGIPHASGLHAQCRAGSTISTSPPWEPQDRSISAGGGQMQAEVWPGDSYVVGIL
ncbi:hypothetical protein KIL84_016896 [Mauremys mutica]|uniref:Uncharacterized protein n=1 Tax=Mauremys mutica TaxID=74926 RepID=A0A9D3X5B5_9SAUR|nr:hypothetical protein KIL84_016896 [Mauremys mutica]